MAFIIGRTESGSSVFEDIQAALDKHLSIMLSLPPVAWENTTYKPTKDTLYIRPTNLPGDTLQASLGTSGEDNTIGVYQIDVFAPGGAGKNEGIAMGDKIANHFKRGTNVAYNGVNVRSESVSRGSARNDNGWYQIPITINYYSYTQARL